MEFTIHRFHQTLRDRPAPTATANTITIPGLQHELVARFQLQPQRVYATRGDVGPLAALPIMTGPSSAMFGATTATDMVMGVNVGRGGGGGGGVGASLMPVPPHLAATSTLSKAGDTPPNATAVGFAGRRASGTATSMPALSFGSPAHAAGANRSRSNHTASSSSVSSTAASSSPSPAPLGLPFHKIPAPPARPGPHQPGQGGRFRRVAYQVLIWVTFLRRLRLRTVARLSSRGVHLAQWSVASAQAVDPLSPHEQTAREDELSVLFNDGTRPLEAVPLTTTLLLKSLRWLLQG